MEDNSYQNIFKNLKLSNKNLTFIIAGAVTLLIFIILLIINIPVTPKTNEEPPISTEITQVDEDDITESPIENVSDDSETTTETVPEPTPEPTPTPEPAPEPTPAPAPTPSIIGEADFCHLFHIKVLELTKNISEKDNKTLIRIKLEVTNTYSSNFTYNAYLGHIEYKSSSYGWDHLYDRDIPSDGLPSYFSLTPGETRTGYVYGWVPKDKSNTLRYQYDPSADGDCVSTIDLQ